MSISAYLPLELDTGAEVVQSTPNTAPFRLLYYQTVSCVSRRGRYKLRERERGKGGTSGSQDLSRS